MAKAAAIPAESQVPRQTVYGSPNVYAKSIFNFMIDSFSFHAIIIIALYTVLVKSIQLTQNFFHILSL